MPRRPPPRPVFRLVWRTHRLIWRLSGGRLGASLGEMPVLELITTGHKSGLPRSVLLSFVPTPEGPALVASNAGEDRDPAWARNLMASPDAQVRERGEWREVQARLVEGAAREALFEQFVRHDPQYEVYRRRTDRSIPVFVLEG